MKDSGSGQLRVQGMVDDSGYAAPKVLIGYRGVPSIGYRRFRVQGLGQSGYLESKVFRVASGSGSSGFGVGDLRVRVCVCVCLCVCVELEAVEPYQTSHKTPNTWKPYSFWGMGKYA